jgi:uncharacterized protein YndB with AHSA1/START domain
LGRLVVVERHVPGSTEDVFAAWTSADGLARWWWPHIADTTYRFEARAGGSYEIRSAAAGIGVKGEVREIDAPHRLRFTWRWLNDGVAEAEEPVDVELAPDGAGGTRVMVRHVLDDAADQGDGIREGWESVLGRLQDLFAAV